MQSFVEDLLDVRQFKEGVFELEKKAFDPNETLTLIGDIFRAQAELKGLSITT